MILTCPCCGGRASAEAWQNDADARQAMAELVKLPQEIQPVCFRYMRLFRPVNQSLRWAKVVKLLAELREMIGAGYVHVQGKPDRNCPPVIWLAAMTQMTERESTLSLPMKNHNYLRQIAWQLADEADRTQEAAVRRQEASHSGFRRQETGARPQGTGDGEQSAEPVSLADIHAMLAQARKGCL